MGVWISRLFSVFGEKEARILILGLDNAGKTTILYQLHLGQVSQALRSFHFLLFNHHALPYVVLLDIACDHSFTYS